MTVDERKIWFNVANTDGLGPAAAQKIARYLEQQRCGAEMLLDLEIDVLTRDVGLSASVALALAEQLRQPVELPNELDEVELLTPNDEQFPNSRFTTANPPLTPVLWAMGNRSLLAGNAPAVAIAGSRDASDEILERARDIATQLSQSGWLVVSGLAQGVDSAAHEGALRGRAGTIGVLASGIANRSRSWMPDELDSMCIVSQFQPHEPWSGPRAMQRNSTIASLADRVLVAAAGESGGSWEMAQLCLKRRKPLFVLDLDESVAKGNRKLIRAGAIPIGSDPNEFDRLIGELPGQKSMFGE